MVVTDGQGLADEEAHAELYELLVEAASELLAPEGDDLPEMEEEAA
jgi:hypothetical protein